MLCLCFAFPACTKDGGAKPTERAAAPAPTSPLAGVWRINRERAMALAKALDAKADEDSKRHAFGIEVAAGTGFTVDFTESGKVALSGSGPAQDAQPSAPEVFPYTVERQSGSRVTFSFKWGPTPRTVSFEVTGDQATWDEGRGALPMERVK